MTPTSPERPEVECEICRDSGGVPLGKDENGLMYPAATRSTIAHEHRDNRECRELRVCEDCRIEVGAVFGPEAPTYDEDGRLTCYCEGDLPMEVWANGSVWVVRHQGGEIVEAAGPVHRYLDDALDVLREARSLDHAKIIAAAVRAMRAIGTPK